MSCGHTLVELLVAMPLGALLLALLLGTIVAQSRLAHGITARLGNAETVRITTGVLRHELRWANSEDVRGSGPDSVSIRLLRGVGVTCGAAARARVVVEYEGIREPNPVKDSVIVVHDGGQATFGLISSTSVTSPCTGASARELELSAAAPSGILLVYEVGTYYLSTRALRFRSGSEGRQPLTDESLQDAGTAFAFLDGSPVPSGVVLQLRGQATRWRWGLPNALSP